TEFVQGAREVRDAAFVGNAEQGATDHDGFGIAGQGRGCTHGLDHLWCCNGIRGTAQSSPCWRSFLRRVPRLRPSMRAATLWLLRAFCITASSSGGSTSLSTIVYSSLTRLSSTSRRYSPRVALTQARSVCWLRSGGAPSDPLTQPPPGLPRASLRRRRRPGPAVPQAWRPH